MASTDVATAPAPAVDEVTPVSQLVTLAAAMESIQSQLRDAKALCKVVAKDVARLEKQKAAGTRGKKRRAPALDEEGNPVSPKPSGFTLPVPIKPALTAFLNEVRTIKGEQVQKPGENVARTDVTRAVTFYVKHNDLQDPNEKRVIVLDGKLASLFSANVGDRVTWFKLQSHLSPLYVNTKAAAKKDAAAKETPAPKAPSKKAAKTAAEADDTKSATSTTTSKSKKAKK